MESIKYELKYCEGCGTLKLRPVLVNTHRCRVCERLLTRFRFPRKMLASGRAALPQIAELRRTGGTPQLAGGSANAGRPQ